MGVPDDLFWSLSVTEVEALMEELDYQRALQAARVVAGMGNLQRRKGTPALKATDMVRRAGDRPKPEDFEHLREHMAPSRSIRE